MSIRQREKKSTFGILRFCVKFPTSIKPETPATQNSSRALYQGTTPWPFCLRLLVKHELDKHAKQPSLCSQRIPGDSSASQQHSHSLATRTGPRSETKVKSFRRLKNSRSLSALTIRANGQSVWPHGRSGWVGGGGWRSGNGTSPVEYGSDDRPAWRETGLLCQPFS